MRKLAAVVPPFATLLVGACGASESSGGGPSSCNGSAECRAVTDLADAGARSEITGSGSNCTGASTFKDSPVTTTFAGWIGIASSPPDIGYSVGGHTVAAAFLRAEQKPITTGAVLATDGPCTLQDSSFDAQSANSGSGGEAPSAPGSSRSTSPRRPS
jgi:hypothetical protein